MTKSKNSEKGHKIQHNIFNILYLSIYYHFYIEYLQSESHEYSLYKQITFSCLTCFHFVKLVRKMLVLSKRLSITNQNGCNGSKPNCTISESSTVLYP